MKLKLIWFPLIFHPSTREHGASYAFISILEAQPGPASCDHNNTLFYPSLPQSFKKGNFWTTWKDQDYRGPPAFCRGGQLLWPSIPVVQLLFFQYRAPALSRYSPSSLFFLPVADIYFFIAYGTIMAVHQSSPLNRGQMQMQICLNIVVRKPYSCDCGHSCVNSCLYFSGMFRGIFLPIATQSLKLMRTASEKTPAKVRPISEGKCSLSNHPVQHISFGGLQHTLLAILCLWIMDHTDFQFIKKLMPGKYLMLLRFALGN